MRTAVLLLYCRCTVWKRHHPDMERCRKCPTCIALPCMQILWKVAAHPMLLQLSADETAAAASSPSSDRAAFAKDFLIHSLGIDLLRELGGVYRSTDLLLSQHQHRTGGKMTALQRLLEHFRKRMDRCLIFSHSTKMLTILQDYIRARGWRCLRLDGTTPAAQRSALCDEFNQDATIAAFLISTKAGGEGLNLKAATKVIIYDVNWNPAADLVRQYMMSALDFYIISLMQ